MPSSKSVVAQFAEDAAYGKPSSYNSFKTTTITCTGGSTSAPILVSHSITACSTSNMEEHGSKELMSLNSGACPSGWNYNAIAGVIQASTVTTTALCCASGYRLRSLSQDPHAASSVVSNQCERWIKSPEKNHSSAMITASDCDGTLAVHKAWAVTWHASDRATLSPKPPTLSSEQTIGFWEAPQEGASQVLLARYEGNDTAFTDSYVIFLMVGLPIIFGALFTCLFCMCYWNRRKMRKERKKAEETQLDSLPPYSANQGPPTYTN